jgi:hypothetical protein
MAYDFKLRCEIAEENISATRSRTGDYFGWYEGEEVILNVTHGEELLQIKLDKKGSVSLKRSGSNK